MAQVAKTQVPTGQGLASVYKSTLACDIPICAYCLSFISFTKKSAKISKAMWGRVAYRVMT